MPGVILDGQVVLITGGARGIGAETARRLVDRGVRVALVDADGEEAERRASELGSRAAAFEADVTDQAQIDAAVEGTLENFGRIDATVAGAGILGMAATTATVEAADYERVIDVNLHGVWRTLRATIPHVLERRGYLLPIASIAAVAPVPLLTAYGMSKAAVESLAMGLRMELAHRGVAVGVAYFGVIDTDLVRGGYSQPAAARVKDVLPARVSRPIPVGRAGAAIVRGIERRSKRVYAPRWVPALLATRGVAGPSHDLLARRRDFIEACRVGERSS